MGEIIPQGGGAVSPRRATGAQPRGHRRGPARLRTPSLQRGRAYRTACTMKSNVPPDSDPMA